MSRLFQLRTKRVIDLQAAVCGLVLLSSFFVLIGLPIKFCSPGPIF
jgi:lipopolysaccharide/colanic/teichoic acid biosynthesis glycosyltransferase